MVLTTPMLVSARGMMAIVGAIALILFVSWLFYGFTLHLAATFFIGDVPSQLAAKAAITPVILTALLQQYGIAENPLITPGIDLVIAVIVALIADGIAIAYVYRLSRQSAAILTLLHFGFAVVLGVALTNLIGFL